MVAAVVPLIASAAGSACVALARKPVQDFLSRATKKVADFALRKLPVISNVNTQYQVLCYALSEAKRHAVKYSHKKSIPGFEGKTEQALGDFFKKTNEESNIDEWDILSNNYDHQCLSDIQALLKQIYHHTDDLDLMQARAAQVFAKKVISNCANQLKPGFEIDLPVVSRSGKKELATYVLDHKFDLWEGIPAFGFVDKEGKRPPLICFRSTQYKLEDSYALPALVANLHHQGPAWKLYKNGHERVEEWLEKSTRGGKLKARAYGYSQGGTTASYYLTYKAKYMSGHRNEPSFVLCAPGVSSKVAKDFEAIAAKPRVISYINRGDLFPKIGQRLIGHAFEINLPNKMPAWHAHSALSLLASRWTIQVIDKEKESRSNMRIAFSTFQKGVGHVFYPVIKDYILPKVKAALY